MIKNQWYAVLESKELKINKLLGAKRLGERLAFWRNNKGEVICFKDKCAHRGASLAAGRICSDNEAIQCPFHGFEYDNTGKCRLIPANGRSSKVPEYFFVDKYPVKENHGLIFIWWGDPIAVLPDVPNFNDLNDRDYSYTTFTDQWPVHYSRAVENQLDLVHVPFVHYDTIGRGNKTLVNGPVQIIKQNQIEFWVYNEIDAGQSPKKSEDLPLPDENKQHIHFIFPNVWQNWILPALRVLVAFVPIDGENTLIYVRTYQKFTKIPLIKQLVDFIMLKFSRKILSQDKRVVLTQIPIYTELNMNEKLIAGDLPIITYRKMRDELKNK
jgi:phenylpropionate dioxygenase-like ring-hydroxylating dioxygenase large terminal subunit